MKELNDNIINELIKIIKSNENIIKKTCDININSDISEFIFSNSYKKYMLISGSDLEYFLGNKIIKSDILDEEEFIFIEKSNVIILDFDGQLTEFDELYTSLLSKKVNPIYYDVNDKKIKTKFVFKIGIYYPEDVYYFYNPMTMREKKLKQLGI